jgi:hypothetical protein
MSYVFSRNVRGGGSEGEVRPMPSSVACAARMTETSPPSILPRAVDQFPDGRSHCSPEPSDVSAGMLAFREPECLPHWENSKMKAPAHTGYG